MTNNSRLWFAVVAVFALLALTAQIALAADWPRLDPEDAKNIMPVSQLKRGMKGYGLTVFQGTKIEKFDVEILGVLEQMNMGKDLILVRINGGPINSRDTGIIAGMSGSPVYINGKIVGAVAYGAQFAKEPVGMLTPIADMLEAWDENLPKQASGYSSPQRLPQPVSVDGKSVSSVALDPYGSAPTAIENGVLHIQPLMTPLMVSGLSPRGLNRLADILQPFGIQPMAGPGGGAASGADPDLVPGAAVGVSLASGDIDMTGIGTLTYRRGDRVVGFGHPMLSIGAVDAPMTTAYVSDVLSSYMVSSKMASPIKTVGRVFQDRPWCVAGTLKEKATLIPVTVNVDDLSSSRKRKYSIQVINHPLLASRLITLMVGEAIAQMHPTPGDSTAEVTYEVVADKVGKISRTNVFFDPIAVDSAALTDIGSLLELLRSNKFQPLDIQAVNLNVKIADRRDTATIDRIFVKRSEYEPGDRVDVGVVLRPYKQDRVTRSFSIKVPATAEDGKLLLSVRGGGAQASPMGMPMVQVMGADDEPAMGGSRFANVDNVRQLVDKYLERERNSDIVVQLQMRTTTVNVAGEKLTGLPTAIAEVMKSSRNSGLKLERDEVKEVFGQDMIVYGAAQLSIDVKKKSLNERSGGSKPATSSSESDGDSSSSSSSSSAEPMMDDPYGDDFISYATGLAGDDDDSVEVTEETVDSVDEAEKDSSDDSAAKPSDSGSSSPSTTATSQTDVKTVVRQAKSWMQKTQADFAAGTFSGVSASSKDRLQLVPTLGKLVETPEQFVWCLAAGKGGVYAGTGDAGRIYFVGDDGKMSVFYETGELEVHALAVDGQGNLYAGTSPNGRIFKVSPDGKGQVLVDLEERYVLALALDDQGAVYAGVGDAGKVYRIGAAGKAELYAQVNEQQILSLDWGSAGLLAGTGINGVVYRITAGKAAPIFDAAESSITAVVSAGAGTVYAGTSPKGVVYKITPDGRSKSVFTGATRVLSMSTDKAGNIYAVSDGNVARIDPDDTAILLDSAREKVQFLAVAYDDPTATLYAGTGNIGSVYRSKCSELTGGFESPVHDSKMISRWGRIRWTAQVPDGGAVEFRTRTGNVETPDSTWSQWSAPYTSAAGQPILEPAARYIQYSTSLKAGASGESPRVSSVTLTYLTPNSAPTVKLTAPAGGEVWSAGETIKWTGSDPDKDTLTYDVYYSSDGGANWTALAGGVGGSTAKTEKEIVDKVTAELDKSPDVPQEMKDKVLKSEPKANGAATQTASNGKSVTNTSHPWDTKKAKDGAYLIKVIASDKTSNAADPQTAEVVSEPFIVCNSGPKLTLYSRGIALKSTGSASLTGSASSELVEVVGVQFRIDGGAWAAAVPEDGIFDSPYEGFSLSTAELAAGAHKLEVQAIDAAGNASNSTVEVKVG